MEKDSKIYIAGHKGLVGSTVKEKLEMLGFTNLIHKNSSELDLRNQSLVKEFFEREKPEYVFLCAAKVGGIKANKEQKGAFIYDNLEIQSNVIKFSKEQGVKKLINISSNCMYPTESQQPMKEEYIMTGKLEPTNDAFAMAKLAGLKMCQSFNEQYKTNFITVIPASLYGPRDNFSPLDSHFVAAMIRRFYQAKLENKPEVELWGDGKPMRELLYVEDLADALLFLMKNYNSSEPINVGLGSDLEIREIAGIIKEVVGYEGSLTYEGSSGGMFRKLLDSSKINSLGWKAETSLKEGLKKTYEWFKENVHGNLRE